MFAPTKARLQMSAAYCSRLRLRDPEGADAVAFDAAAWIAFRERSHSMNHGLSKPEKREQGTRLSGSRTASAP